MAPRRKTSRSMSSCSPSPPPITARLTLYAHNLKTGQTASLSPDLPVKTASTSRWAFCSTPRSRSAPVTPLLPRSWSSTHANQVEGSGVLGQLTAPLALTLGDTLTLMVILSDNTATNMAIDRLGLAHINATLRAAGLKQTWLYKKVYVPATGPMPADQPQFGLGKTTAREMAAIMERFATCRLSLDNSPPGARPMAPSAARFSTCSATSRIATAARAISKPWIPASKARPSPTRSERSTRCATMSPWSPPRPGR